MGNPARIAVAMSGGVDSSCAAKLVRDAGVDCAGIFMKNWEEDDGGHCPAEADAADARSVASILSIEFYARNFAPEYWDHVFEAFLREYHAGRTPNPDVLCNREIKFRVFVDHAVDLGATHVATGHYARKMTRDGIHYLLRGRDPSKDQSYFLYALDQDQLRPALFPVGDMLKSNVRSLAADAGLPVHSKKDSTGICFIGERKLQNFLSRWLPPRPGEIRTDSGRVVGEHRGAWCFTLGQRRGLGIGGVRGAEEAPWYVIGKNMATNTVYVSQEHEHEALMSDTLTLEQVNWIGGAGPDQTSLAAKIRYRQPDQQCEIQPDNGTASARIRFAEQQWAAMPGQSVVLYDGEVCLGGGVIQATNAPAVT